MTSQTAFAAGEVHVGVEGTHQIAAAVEAKSDSVSSVKTELFLRPEGGF